MSTVWEAGDAGQEAEAERLVTGAFTEDDLEIDRSLRPRRLDEYLGQARVKDNLGVLIDAARQRDEPLDHVLALRTAGAGKKATLAQVISNELGVKLKDHERPGHRQARRPRRPC